MLNMNTNNYINCTTAKEKLHKQKFTLKSIRRDGLVLQLQRSNEPSKIRFIHACFNSHAYGLAVADSDGYIFIVDLSSCLFWGLPGVRSCTVLKFSPLSDDELIVGSVNGTLYITDVASGQIWAKLRGHSKPVNHISFSRECLCLSSSTSKAILWDLKTNCMIQSLSLKYEGLRRMIFIPVSNDVVACFSDNIVHVWKYGSFENFKQILPLSTANYAIKSLAFTRNGRAMLIGGYSSQIIVILLDTWKVRNIINLPTVIASVKHMEFVPQPFDGGCNKTLCILSGQGVVYFYDMEQNKILSEVREDQEIQKFSCSKNGTYIACILCSGEIRVYCISNRLPNEANKTVRVNSRQNYNKRTKTLQLRKNIQTKISEILVSDKLISILKQFGQFPSAYRPQIWVHLLQLPCNVQQYGVLLNNMRRGQFANIEKEYPLENKMSLKNMKSLLKALAAWFPFLQRVDYLPVFVYPFVKIFSLQPLLCFEAVATIILNWCQHWFEFYPQPPTNVLAIIENLLIEHDSQLLGHLKSCGVTSEVYGWSLLEMIFSEVLSSEDWCIFWDHVLTNEPAFLFMAVVAYNVQLRDVLLELSDLDQIAGVYHRVNPVDVKRLVAKSYSLLNKTSKENHPKQYLCSFIKLDPALYVKFQIYR